MLILCVHGLNGTTNSLYFLTQYLAYHLSGCRIDTYAWPSGQITFSQAIDDLSNYLLSQEDTEIILVGHSLGGMLSLAIKDERIKGVITVSTPHTACAIAEMLNYILGPYSSYFLGQMYEPLTQLVVEKSTPYLICITSSLAPLLNFDGRIFVSEMVHPHADEVHHLTFSDHGWQLYDPRMWSLIHKSIISILTMNRLS